MIRINGYFCNITRCIAKEWSGPIQMHRLQGEYIVSNGFGGIGILDTNTQMLLRLYMPMAKAIQLSIGVFNGNGYIVYIKIFFP